MKDRVFIDTNLWVYLYSDETKGSIIRNIVNKYFCSIVISTQVLGELFNVLIKKIRRPKEEAKDIISNLITNFGIKGIEELLVLKAIEINIKYKYSYWDSLIIASALEAGCYILYTEDMQNGQIIEGRLGIVNPFEERAKG